MKKIFLFSIAMMIFLVFSNAVMGEDATKIGVIDLPRCIKESKEGQKAFQLLKKKKDTLQQQFDKKQKELLELRKEFEKQSMMLSMDAQKDKKKTIERKTRELEYFYKDLNEEMKKVQEKERGRILKELTEVIKKMGAEQDYLLIMEKRAGGVLYSADSVDITDKVITEYDQMNE